MKIFIFIFLFAVAFAAPISDDGPSQISDNNVGNIISVGIDGKINWNNNINAFLMSIAFLLRDQQGVIAVAPSAPMNDKTVTSSKLPKLDPKALEYLSKYLGKYNLKK
jgi:hypothetical protein